MKKINYIFTFYAFSILLQFGCSKENADPIPPVVNPPACATAVPGSLFKEVKTLITNKCVSCHNPNGQNPAFDLRDNCVIQSRASLIKQRAVDLGNMPPTGPLSQNDKDKITAWVTAGGRVTD